MEIEYSLEFGTMLKRLRKFVPHISPQFGASHPASHPAHVLNIHFIFTVNINQGKSNSIEVFEIKVITGRSDSFSRRGTWSRRHFSDERLFTLFQLVIEVLLLLFGAFWYRGG